VRHPDVATVRHVYEALAVGNHSSARSILTDDAELEHHADWLDEDGLWRAVPLRFIDLHGGRILVVVREEPRNPRTPGTGLLLEPRLCCHLWTLRSGRAMALQVRPDHEAALADEGLV